MGRQLNLIKADKVHITLIVGGDRVVVKLEALRLEEANGTLYGGNRKSDVTALAHAHKLHNLELLTCEDRLGANVLRLTADS